MHHRHLNSICFCNIWQSLEHLVNPQETLYSQSSMWPVTAQPLSQHFSQRTGCVTGVISYFYFTSLPCSAMAMASGMATMFNMAEEAARGPYFTARLPGRGQSQFPADFCWGSSSSETLFRAVQMYPARGAKEEPSLIPKAPLSAEKWLLLEGLPHTAL